MRIRVDTEIQYNALIYKHFINHIRLSAHFFTRTREYDFTPPTGQEAQ